MKKYLNQTTVNVIALAGAAAWGLCFIGNITGIASPTRGISKEMASARVDHEKQMTSNRYLDYEMARLKNCGELKRSGIEFNPQSSAAWLCADVILTEGYGE